MGRDFSFSVYQITTTTSEPRRLRFQHTVRHDPKSKFYYWYCTYCPSINRWAVQAFRTRHAQVCRPLLSLAACNGLLPVPVGSQGG